MMKSLRLSFLLFLAALAVPQAAPALDHGLEEAVHDQLKDKVLVLLHPLAEDSLRFDADGKPLEAKPPGPWTVYAGVKINKVQLSPDELRMEGHRIFFTFNKSKLVAYEFNLFKNRLNPPCKPLVEIAIKLDQPVSSLDQARKVLGKVFAFTKQDFLDSLPAYWHTYVERNFEFDPAGSGRFTFQVKPPADKDTAPDANSHPSVSDKKPEENASAVLKVGRDVKAPKAKYSPEPVFSQAARYEKYVGMVVVYLVVDAEGKVAEVSIVSPAGLGLDDQAAVGVKDWRFDPATRDGKPVAVVMNVEIRFALY